MNKFIKKLLVGVLTGVAFGLILYALGFLVEVGHCTWILCTCSKHNKEYVFPFMWDKTAFFLCILFTALGGGIIGGVYGYVLQAQENRAKLAEANLKMVEADLAGRKSNAAILKTEVASLLNAAYSKKSQMNDYEVKSNYYADKLQKEGWAELETAYETNAELQVITEEISE